MTKSELLAKMQDAGAWLPQKTVKIDFGSDDCLLARRRVEGERDEMGLGFVVQASRVGGMVDVVRHFDVGNQSQFG